MNTSFQILENAAFESFKQRSKIPLQNAMSHRSIDELKRAMDIAWFYVDIENKNRTKVHEVYEFLYGLIVKELDSVNAL